jgi:RNA polymerase sigma factor (sigma-70 family)
MVRPTSNRGAPAGCAPTVQQRRGRRSNHQLVDGLRRAFGRLPTDCRAILSLRYLHDVGLAEIARILEVPEGTVKSRLHHARTQLKSALERR